MGLQTRTQWWVALTATVCAGVLSVGSAVASFAVDVGAQQKINNWGSSTSFPMKITNVDGSTFTGQMGLVMDGSSVKVDPQNPSSAYQYPQGVNPASFVGYNVEPSLGPPGLTTYTAFDPVTTIPTGADKATWIRNQHRIAAVLKSTFPAHHWDEFRPNICNRLTGCLRVMSIGTQLMLWKLAGHNVNPGKGMTILNQEKTAASTDSNYAGLQESHVMWFYTYLSDKIKGVGNYEPSQGASPITFWRPSGGTHGAVTLGPVGGAKEAVAPSPQAAPATYSPPPAATTPPAPQEPIAQDQPAPTATADKAPTPITPTLPNTGVNTDMLRALAWWSAVVMLLGIGLVGRSRELMTARTRHNSAKTAH